MTALLELFDLTQKKICVRNFLANKKANYSTSLIQLLSVSILFGGKLYKQLQVLEVV